VSSGIYRARLRKSPDKKTAQFLSSLEDDYRIFEVDIEGTEAHNIMLYEQGILSKKDLSEILTSLEKLRTENKSGKIEIESEYEDVHEFIETYVIRDIGIEVGGKLHTGRSRNDQVALDIRMSLRWGIIEVAERILHLTSSLLDRAEECKGAVMPLYTHTQPAQVGTLTHYLLAYVDVLLRDLERLDSCYKRVDLSPLGAGPIGGTSIPVDRKRTASLLGFAGLMENSIDAVSSKDTEIEFLSVLANLMSSLSRATEDLVLWSSSEFGYIELAEDYSSTSSIMPQKKNPCTLELIRGRTGRVFGALNGILSMVKGLTTGYNRDLQETKHYLWIGLDTVSDSLEILAGAFETMNVDKASMMAKVTDGYVVALDLAESFVKLGLSFREAHMLVGNLIREMVASRIRMSELTPEVVEKLAEQLLGRRIKINGEFIRRIVNTECSLLNRKSTGSPNPDETERMLKTRDATLKTRREVWLSKKKALEKARNLLKETVKKYMSEI